MARPERLFRYFSPKASDLFSDQRLWFSAVKEFNDPFDVAPRHDKAAEERARHRVKVEFAFLPRDAPFDWRGYERGMEPHVQRIVESTSKTGPAKFQAQFSEAYGVVCFCEIVSSLF